MELHITAAQIKRVTVYMLPEQDRTKT